MSETALTKARALIKEHGWVVEAVSDLGCECCQDAGHTPHKSGKDPYLYTVGLTAAGLPELLLTLPGKNSREWLTTGHRALNHLGQHSLHDELTIGQVIPVGIGAITATVQRPPRFNRDSIWPGLAFALYGWDRVRLIQVVPDW